MDVYGFGNLYGDNEPMIIYQWGPLEVIFSMVDSEFAVVSSRFVNQGVKRSLNKFRANFGVNNDKKAFFCGRPMALFQAAMMARVRCMPFT